MKTAFIYEKKSTPTANRCAPDFRPETKNFTPTVYRLRAGKSRENEGFTPRFALDTAIKVRDKGTEMYLKKIIVAGNIIEVEKYHTARYGIKGIRPAKKSRPTPEQMQKVNERNAIKRLRRLINANFDPGDYHTVLTYRRDERPGPDEAKKQLSRFIAGLRRDYRKAEKELRYITVTEYKGKAIHHHLVINRIESTDKLVSARWPFGRPHNTLLDDAGEYGDLAAYLVKETQSSFREAGNPNKLRYSCSRNLIKPKEIVKVIQGNEWKKEPKPVKGYEIIKDSVTEGISEHTGYGYQYYMMRRIKGGKDKKSRKNKNHARRGSPDPGDEP